MKTRLLLVSMMMLLLGAGSAWAAAAGSGLVGTGHDFTGWSTTPAVGLCTGCHTAHKAINTRLLWNHTLSTNTFSWTDVTKTIGGTDLPSIATSWTGPTKYCLSCHDGSVAIGDLNWWNEAARKGASALNNTKLTGAYQTASATGSMNGNHPVAFPYPANNAVSKYNGVTTGGMVPVTEFVTNPMTSNGIRLFTDTGSGVKAGVTTGATGMECSSCHDPHNGSDVLDGYFLRGKLAGNATDYICFKCHAK